jgi:transcription elongation factor Elf1
MISIEEQKRIVSELNHKIPTLKCPMCNHNNFVLAEGYFTNSLQAKVGSFVIGGPAIPTIPIICSNCGFLSQHAMGVLGLLPEEMKPKTAAK